MKKKGKTKQQILFEEKTKPFLNDYSNQVQDKIERKKIKEAIRKIADAAEQRIKKLNAELNFVRGLNLIDAPRFFLKFLREIGILVAVQLR